MSDGRKLWLSKATQSKCKTTPRSRIQLASGISIPYWEEKHCCRIRCRRHSGYNTTIYRSDKKDI